VGLLAGLFIGVSYTPPWFEDAEGTYLFWWAVAGLAGGCLMILIDPPAKKTAGAEAQAAPAKPGDASPLMGRLFAALSLPLVVVPPLGLAVSVSALIASRRERGWHRVLAKITFGLSLALCLFFAGMVFLVTYFPPPSHPGLPPHRSHTLSR
jgi:hypothetical protein